MISQGILDGQINANCFALMNEDGVECVTKQRVVISGGNLRYQLAVRHSQY